jgi:hypothetical protein
MPASIDADARPAPPQRVLGAYNVITVPSRAHRIPQTTKFVLREVPAFWVYYLRAVLH